MNCRRRLQIALVAGLGIAGLVHTAGAADVVKYYHSDAIGNVRAVTDRAGNVLERFEYYPFGEDVTSPSTPTHRRFTGKERDDESGLDYFGARHYLARTARFTSVDPASMSSKNVFDPQLWNRYAYGRNNPWRYVDPDGREITYATPGLQTYFTRLAGRSAEAKAVLSLYEGAANPNLHINVQDDLGREGGADTGGMVTPTYGTFTTDAPPGSGNYPFLDRLNPAQIGAGVANGSLRTSIALESVQLTLKSELDLMAMRFDTKSEKRTLGVALHELGHARDVALYPLAFFELTHDRAQQAMKHDDRDVEKSANAFKDEALKSFPK